jgi:prepilin-type N-terminal cleavage/methylation domain-containing protein/prepilin-type processing-associated H-X9-DG protein
MKQNLIDELKKAEHRGFTLIELVVVIAVVAVLLALQISALARATRQTVAAQCAENLRQFTCAAQIYGHEFNNRLPNNTAGFWAWDLDWRTGELLDRYGAPWKVLYCPGTAPRFDDAANYTLYLFGSASFHVIGYAHTFPGSTTLDPTNQNATLFPPTVPVSFGVSRRETAAERVFLADATISVPGQNNEALRNTYNYTIINGGFSIAHTSPHLGGNIPLGGNVSMLDGHVEWRSFPNMHVRTSSGSAPTFWW